MLINQQMQHYRALYQWFKSPLGILVAREFNLILNSLPILLKGDTLLQLGSCGANLWLNNLQFNHKWVASSIQIKETNDIECGLSQLPFGRNSINCVLAPLSLEPFGCSFGLLDEIDRVLKPMGYVILLCINPISLWGPVMKLGLSSCFGKNTIKLRTAYSINRIFMQRGYKQLALINFCYIPPINNQKFIEKLSFLNEIGKMIWPFPSGLYCYIAQKYECIPPSLSLSLREINEAITYQRQ